MNYYYISSENKAEGPVSAEQLQALLAAGTISAATQVAPVGSQQWAPLATAIPVPVAAPAAGNAPPPIGQTFGAPAPAAPSEPLALVSLILACLSFACGGFFLSIPAVICAHIALKKIKANPSLEGKGLATGGMWVGYANIAVSVLIMLFYILMIIVAVATDAGRH